MDQTQHLSTQLERMERLVDADSGAIRNSAGLAKLLAEPF